MSWTKELRDAKGWSQGEMAEYLGAHRTTVSRLESGQIPEDGPWERLLNEASSARSRLNGKRRRPLTTRPRHESSSPSRARCKPPFHRRDNVRGAAAREQFADAAPPKKRKPIRRMQPLVDE